MENEWQRIEYDQLTPAQKEQANAMFAPETQSGHPMTNYTYALREDGTVFQWRYYKPSQACLDMMQTVLTGK